MQSSNFGFLADIDTHLVTLGAFAEQYFRNDPSTAIFKLRQFKEPLSKLIAAHNAFYRDTREGLEETLSRSPHEGLISKEVADLFHRVRRSVNIPAHGTVGTRSEALSSLNSSAGWRDFVFNYLHTQGAIRLVLTPKLQTLEK